MAHSGSLNTEQPVTLATTCTRINGVGQARWLVLYESDVDVYVVTAEVADGAALPSTGRAKIEAANMPQEINIAAYGYLSLAGSGAGTVRAEFRS